MNAADANRPLRVLDKVLEGGLGVGNVGVVMARHGLGKVAVLTSIALDHAMDERNTLHVCVGKSVSSVRAFHDEVLHEILTSLDLPDQASILTSVERHKQIYSFPDPQDISIERLRTILTFLDEHAEFRPEMIELSGWPEFESMDSQTLPALKQLAVERQCEIWCTAHTHLDDPKDPNGIPELVARHLDHLEVVLALEPEKEHVNLEFVKTHGTPKDGGIHLEFDPKTMLIRWR